MSSHEDRVTDLVQEIRDLYVRTCALADRYGEVSEAEDRELIEKCRPRGNPVIPELAYFKSVFDQQEAIQRAVKDTEYKRVVSRVQTWSTLVLAGACIVLFQRTGSVTATTMLVMAGAVAAFAIANRCWYRGILQKLLRRELVGQGVPICVECGYDLRGQREPRCPECNAACDPKLVNGNQAGSLRSSARIVGA